MGSTTYKLLALACMALIFLPNACFAQASRPICFSRSDYARIGKLKKRCKSYKTNCSIKLKALQKKERASAKQQVRLAIAGIKPKLDACDNLLKSKSNEQVWKGVAIGGIVAFVVTLTILLARESSRTEKAK